VLKNEYLCTLGSYHRDGVNKDKIILVSQAANIVSKYTAFVGVDKMCFCNEHKIHTFGRQPSVEYPVSFQMLQMFNTRILLKCFSHGHMLIILVSQAANIVSKYTAFVGVDKDTKVPVSTIKEKPEYDEAMVCNNSFLS
jgi:hypothetical protein